MQTRKSAVLMRAQVVENLVTLISSRELACGQEVGRVQYYTPARRQRSQQSMLLGTRNNAATYFANIFSAEM
jgi:hypothetical protein